MRTTVDVDPDLLEKLRVEAARRRVSFKELLNAAIRNGLKSTGRGKTPYELPTFRMGAVREGVDLDRALAVADALEDGEVAAELGRRK